MYPSPNPPNPPNALLSGSLDFDSRALTPEFIAGLLQNNPLIGTAAATAFSPVSQPSFYHDAPYVAPAASNPLHPSPSPVVLSPPTHRGISIDHQSMTAGGILRKILEPEGEGVGTQVGMVVTMEGSACLLRLVLLTTVGLRAVEIEVGNRGVR
ncbi:hypothetical protein BS47DRAFT_1019237 [Hydnum rufescens UP504]|uniref:Uncharacterized protein n=1 Tax=Hydnum rufescens UP504 TaxID=1448309 RepID=A0A9P6DKZ6_9AGAM|nr:hypothetical protein BS47DRAFT_1019237 [Hydnum rufescens UP504]